MTHISCTKQNPKDTVQKIDETYILKIYSTLGEFKDTPTIGEQNELKTILLSGKKIDRNDSYSYEINYILKKLKNISLARFLKISKSLSKRENDKINIFKWNGIIYVGFESRRIAYEKDKQKGPEFNPIADKIRAEGHQELQSVIILQI